MKKKAQKRSKKKNIEHIEKYLDHGANSNKSPRTLTNYRLDLEQFLDWFCLAFPGRSLFRSVPQTISTYQSFLNGRPVTIQRRWWKKWFSRKPPGSLQREKSLSPNSQRRHICTLKNFFEFHVQLGEKNAGEIIEENPVKTIIHKVKVKEMDIQHTRMLPPSIWHKLDLLATKKTDRLLLELLYKFGLRISEAANLTVEQFNLDRGTITVVRKGGKVHTIKPFWETEVFDIVAMIKNERASGQIFPGRGFAKLTSRSLYSRIKRMLCAVGADENYSPHSFRKACASRLYRETKDLLLVRDYLNHSDAKVTQTYIQVDYDSSF